MSDKRLWYFYIQDMIKYATRVLRYCEGFSESDFLEDQRTYDAVLRNLELIGEAAKHVPNEQRALYTTVPWRLIIATRNQIIHGYLGIDDEIIWSIITTELPVLVKNLKQIREPES